MNIAYSKDTDKGELIYILIGLYNFVLKQAGHFFNANPNKKEIILLSDVQAMIVSI